MKKNCSLWAVVVLLVVFLIGCSETKEKDSMTFVDTLENPGQEFTIYDDLEFRVRFLNAYFDNLNDEDAEQLEEAGIVKGLVVTGYVRDTNSKWTSSIIEGTARNLKSNQSTGVIVDALPHVEVGVKMSYDSSESPFGSINVEFTSGEMKEISETLMGGKYYRIK